MRAEHFKVVSVLDDAFDLTLSERLDYAGTRDLDAYKHKFKPGSKPVFFHVREVPHALWESFVDAADTYPEKYRRAFMCGVEKVDNLPMADGVTLATWAPSTKNERSGSVILSDEDMALFAPCERAEIGSVIYNHSFLARRMQIVYLLPLSLQEPLVSLDARRAVQNQRDAEAKTRNAHSAPSTPSSGTIDKTSERDDFASDNRTVAAAAIQTSP